MFHTKCHLSNHLSNKWEKDQSYSYSSNSVPVFPFQPMIFEKVCSIQNDLLGNEKIQRILTLEDSPQFQIGKRKQSNAIPPNHDAIQKAIDYLRTIENIPLSQITVVDIANGATSSIVKLICLSLSNIASNHYNNVWTVNISFKYLIFSIQK